MKSLMFIFSVVFISGCATATLVRRDFHPRRAGQVRYSFQGESLAGDKMREFCGGQFKVLSESSGSQQTGMVAQQYGNATVVRPTVREYTYADFECIQ